MKSDPLCWKCRGPFKYSISCSAFLLQLVLLKKKRLNVNLLINWPPPRFGPIIHIMAGLRAITKNLQGAYLERGVFNDIFINLVFHYTDFVNKVTVGIKRHEDWQGNHFHIFMGGVMLGSWAGSVFTLWWSWAKAMVDTRFSGSGPLHYRESTWWCWCWWGTAPSMAVTSTAHFQLNSILLCSQQTGFEFTFINTGLV